MKRLAALSFFLLALLWQAPGHRLAQGRPREGYLRTADGVRPFYKIVGSGTETLVAVPGAKNVRSPAGK